MFYVRSALLSFPDQGESSNEEAVHLIPKKTMMKNFAGAGGSSVVAS